MERFVEPTYYIENHYSAGRPCWYVSRNTEINGKTVKLNDPEYQDWDLTPMLIWCVENFKGEYKICMTDYEDLFIEVYDESDAVAFKLRWS